MENKQYIVAIEIGSSKIVGVIISKTNSTGVNSVVAVEEERISDCVRYGCIKNVEETKMHINSVIHRLESRIPSSKIKGVYVGIAGRSLRSIAHDVTLSLNGEKAITTETMNTLISEARNESFSGFDILDVAPRRYLVDNLEVKKPVGTFGQEIKASVEIIIAKSLLNANIHRVIDPNIEIKDIIVTPLAVADAVLSPEARQLGCMLIDMGAETTTISIYKNDALAYLATLPLGGRNITRDLMSLQLLEDRAEELKRTVNAQPSSKSEISINGVTVNEASNYISARSGEIVANINEQLSFAGIKSNELSSIIIIGGGARLNGFIDLLETTTKLKVVRGSLSTDVMIADPKFNSHDWIPAVALARAAARSIAPSDNCIMQINNQPGLEFGPHKTDEKEEEAPKEPEKGDKHNKSSKMKSLFDRFRKVFDEEDTEIE